MDLRSPRLRHWLYGVEYDDIEVVCLGQRRNSKATKSESAGTLNGDSGLGSPPK